MIEHFSPCWRRTAYDAMEQLILDFGYVQQRDRTMPHSIMQRVKLGIHKHHVNVDYQRITHQFKLRSVEPYPVISLESELFRVFAEMNLDGSNRNHDALRDSGACRGLADQVDIVFSQFSDTSVLRHQAH